MIINHWGPAFTKLYGHIFPESYLCVDTEFTWGHGDKDLVYEIGHVLVENRRVVDRLNIVLDWTHHKTVPKEMVRSFLRQAELKTREAGKHYRVTYQVMQEEGIEPEKALQFYWDLFKTVKARKILFAAHHGYRADEGIFRRHFHLDLGHEEFPFGANGMIDTGAIEKASQVVDSMDPAIVKQRKKYFPTPADTMESYFRRVVNGHAKGIFWNLGETVKKYKLDEKHGLDMGHCHEAEFDALLVHHLMEEYRSQIKAVHVEECPFDTPETMQRAFEQTIAAAKPRAVPAYNDRYEEAAQQAVPQHVPRPVRRRGQRAL
jgi:hypothetical protein